MQGSCLEAHIPCSSGAVRSSPKCERRPVSADTGVVHTEPGSYRLGMPIASFAHLFHGRKGEAVNFRPGPGNSDAVEQVRCPVRQSDLVAPSGKQILIDA